MKDSKSGSLFEEDSEPPGSLVAALAQSKPATREQRQFQRLVAQIEQRREQISSWQAYQPRYNQRVCGEVEPLQARLRAGQRQMITLIDELLTTPGPKRRLGRIQRAKLRALLLNLLEGLLGEAPDPELEAVHDRYSDVSYEQRQSDMHDTQAYLDEVMEMHFGAARTQDQAHGPDPGPHRSRARSAKSEAKLAQREAAAREVRQSLRDVFRKLASALHPDREPDAQARQRKTELMQRVNQAYEADDLLTLLTLQLEIEQISAASLAAASRERLSHYNQILREQLAELDRELTHCIDPFRQILEDLRGRLPTIADVEQGLNAACTMLSAIIRQLQADMVAFRDPALLREHLKHLELEPEPELDEMDELEAFEAMDGLADFVTAFQTAPRQSASGRARRTKRRR